MRNKPLAVFVVTEWTCFSAFAQKAPQVKIDSGLIEGSIHEQVDNFKGIPFAARL